MTTHLYNTIAEMVFCLSIILVATEPECSKYSYEEQLLSKMIRVEFKLEQIEEKTSKIRENVQETLKAIQEEKININNKWSDIKVELKKEIEQQVLKVNATLHAFLSEKTKVLDELRNWKNATTIHTVELKKEMEQQVLKVNATLHAFLSEKTKVLDELRNWKNATTIHTVELKKETEQQVLKVNATLHAFLSEKTKVLDELRNWKNATTIHTDCLDVLREGSRTSGVYNVTLLESREQIDVYCDMDTDGGGWTVFQNRFDGSVDFVRNFSQYDTGFGLLTGEFWLGLGKVYSMTNRHKNILRIDLMDASGETAYETCQNFSLSPSPGYNLHIQAIENTTYTALSFHHDRMPFSTFDKDLRYCAKNSYGGWWYNNCFLVNLNGKYLIPGTDSSSGMIYSTFHGNKSLKRTKMMFRRQ